MLDSVKTKGFLGQFDYELLFNEQIKFVTGPNGYGKTTFLNIVDLFFREDWKKIASVVFDCFEISFSDVIFTFKQSCTEKEDAEEIDEKSYKVTLTISSNDDLCLKIEFEKNDEGEITRKIKEYKTENYKKRLKLFINTNKCFYIPDSRLYMNKVDLKRQIPSLVRFSESLSKTLVSMKYTIQHVLVSEINSITSGVVNEKEVSINANDEAFWAKLKRYKFIQEDEKICCAEQMMTLKEKVGDFLERLDLFQEIIQKCEFTNKTMEISTLIEGNGFLFRLNDAKKQVLDFTSLSSGEKHILTILYSLLFDVEKGSLVLIDEPEMSFHMSWQVSFYDNLLKIAELRKLQCIVATHQPQMFGLDFEKSIDLYELSCGNLYAQEC